MRDRLDSLDQPDTLDRPDTLDVASDSLALARARLEAARDALQPLLDDGIGGEAVQELAARLKRMEAEVVRLEGVVAGVEVTA